MVGQNKYILGIDGGGTRTKVALSDKEGNVLKEKEGSPSNPRNIGINDSTRNIFQLIKDTVNKLDNIALTYIALSSVDEEFSERKEELIQNLKSLGLPGEIVVEGDRPAAFRSGTGKKEGVLVICGTGAVVHGWRKDKEKKASGWGYFSDEGSAFYVGIEGYRAVLKGFDGRLKKTKIIDLIKKEWKVENENDINKKIYSHYKENLPMLSVMVADAAEAGDDIAESIIKNATEELFLSFKTVARDLEFKEEFPLVIIGGMFNSSFFSSLFCEKVRQDYPQAKIIFPESSPAEGAVRLAMEYIRKNDILK